MSKKQERQSKWSYENASRRYDEKYHEDNEEKVQARQRVENMKVKMEQKVSEILKHPSPAYEYQDDDNELKELRKTMMELSNQADRLYMMAKRDGVDIDTSKALPEPVTWIYNQDTMRKMWEDFKDKCEKMGPFGNMLINNSYGNYMKFMYDNYPAGFRKKMMEAYNRGVGFDGAKAYRELKNNS
jgi:hypothetical protein